MTLTDNPDTAAQATAEEMAARRKYVKAALQEHWFSPQVLLHLSVHGHSRGSGDNDRNRTTNTVRWQAMIINRCTDDENMRDPVLWAELKAEVDTPWLQWHKMHDFAAWDALGNQPLYYWFTTNKPTDGSAWTPVGETAVLVPSGSPPAHEVVIDFLDHR